MMNKNTLLALAVVSAFSFGAAAPALAADPHAPLRLKWSPPIRQLTAADQRGFKVYREICQACHSPSWRLHARSDGRAGFGADQTLAAEYQINDGPNNRGEKRGRAANPIIFRSCSERAGRARGHNGALPVG
jgi:cytochrome c1